MNKYIFVILIIIIVIVIVILINNKNKTKDYNESFSITNLNDINNDNIINLIKNKTKDYNESFLVTDSDDIKDDNLINLINNCTDTNNQVTFKDVYINNMIIDDIKFNDYIFNITYPIGSRYVQFPVISDAKVKTTIDLNNEDKTAFPLIERPEILFGGKWKELFNTESVFFRTQGSESNENRDSKGIQNWALRRLKGKTNWIQTDYWAHGAGAEGIFKSEVSPEKTVGTDANTGKYPGVRNLFDTSKILSENTSEKEVRVKNRLCKIWERTA